MSFAGMLGRSKTTSSLKLIEMRHRLTCNQWGFLTWYASHVHWPLIRPENHLLALTVAQLLIGFISSRSHAFSSLGISPLFLFLPFLFSGSRLGFVFIFESLLSAASFAMSSRVSLCGQTACWTGRHSWLHPRKWRAGEEREKKERNRRKERKE